MMSFTSTDLPARLDQHSPGWTLFSHYLCITISLPLSFGVSLSTFLSLLFFNNSLYHLLMLFSPLFQPSALLADLILPFLFMFLFPAGFWGLRTISVFQADFLALLSRSETQAPLLMFSLWSVPLITGNSTLVTPLLFSNLALSLYLWDYLICCLSCHFHLVCPEALYLPFKWITWSWRCQQVVRVLYADM